MMPADTPEPASATSPLILFPDRTLLLRPACCGSIDYYAWMSAFGHVVVDYNARFNKRLKDTHRFSILGTGGVHSLTIPVESRPGMSHAPWGDVTFSEHGQWWHLLWAAIYSAYGRTPYFEFYQDDFEPIFKTHPLSLQAFNSLIDRTVRNILGIPSPATSVEGLAQECSIDLRSRPIPPIPVVEYYQVWSAKYGFTPGLSILDLIFNMGPEAPLILRQMASGINLNDF